MKPLYIKIAIWVWIPALMFIFAFGCSDNASENKQPPITSAFGNGQANSDETFIIYAGSEMSGLEPMIKTWADEKGYAIQIHYTGSIDMIRMMKDGTATPADAYWPAHTIWFTLGDLDNVIKNKRSIMISPIVFGLKQSVVKKFGWDKNPPSIEAFAAAALKNEFKFGKTSSTQSNSGAIAYLMAWWAFAGKPEIWTMDLVNNLQIQSRMKNIESSVGVSSGSSGWLKSKIVENSDKVDGMINYEAMISEANIGWSTIDKHTGKTIHHPGLIERGLEPLHVIYPSDAIVISDHPLGYVNKGNAQKQTIFNALQNFLLSPDAQKEMISKGRRNALLAMNPALSDKKAFNPEYGFDIAKIITPIPLPPKEILTSLLNLYQEEVRKPSATFWVIDDSDSMYKNNGKEAVQEAMSMLLTPDKAKEYKLQSTPRDIHVIIPFSHTPRTPIMARGNDPDILGHLMEKIIQMHLGSASDMYKGVVMALEYIKQNNDQFKDHFTAIAVLSDGHSNGSINTVKQAVHRMGLEDIPIFTLSFGTDTDERQLKELAAAFGGRYFSGQKDLADAFRKMKGYN